MALFKQPDNIVKIITSLKPDENPYNPTISTKNDANDPLRDIPIIFGYSFVTPVLIQKANAEVAFDDVNNLGPAQFKYYALSAAPTKSWASTGFATYNNWISSLYIDGQLVTGLKDVTVTPANRLNFFTNPTFANTSWRGGRTQLGIPQITVGATFDSNGNFFTQDYTNLVVGILKAGDDFLKHPFYELFKNNRNLPIPKNPDYDLLLMYINYDRRVFKSTDPVIQCSYYRYPVIFDPSINAKRIVEPTRGNCLLELLTNSSYGLNLPETKFVRVEFFNVGESISAQFDIVKTPIGEIINIIDSESNTNRVSEIGGVIRYSSVNNTGIAITNDNIIGEISIEYPDAGLAPTQLIGTYNSGQFGSTDIIVGTDTTRVEKINIRTAGNLDEAKLIATNIFRKLNNTITIKFRGDRTLQQFSIFDTVSLVTTDFSAIIKIVDIVMNEDYTFDITGEADTNDAVPTARLGTARPLTKITDAIFIREKDVEITPVPPDQEEPRIIPPAPQPAPPPDEIRPPTPQPITIAGLEHPYNFVTNSYNTNWYLGSTRDGVTIDPLYDTNGIRTRFIVNYTLPNRDAPFYEIDYSLIYRPPNNPPNFILAVTDVHETTAERNLNLVGRTVFIKLTRTQFTGFFSDANLRPRETNSTRGQNWVNSARNNWFNFDSDAYIYPGNTNPVEIYKKSYNLPNYVFQVGDQAEILRRKQCPHTFTTVFKVPNPSGDFWYSSEAMRRITGPLATDRFYRLHFTALYGERNNIRRAEYIGSTSFYGTVAGMKLIDRLETEDLIRRKFIGIDLASWKANAISYNPPPRNLL